jgi:hypothetical protein
LYRIYQNLNQIAHVRKSSILFTYYNRLWTLPAKTQTLIFHCSREPCSIKGF